MICSKIIFWKQQSLGGPKTFGGALPSNTSRGHRPARIYVDSVEKSAKVQLPGLQRNYKI